MVVSIMANSLKPISLQLMSHSFSLAASYADLHIIHRHGSIALRSKDIQALRQRTEP